MRTEASELWFVAPGRVEIRRAPSPAEVGLEEIRARGICSAVSQGTELLLYRGEGPPVFDPSLATAGRELPMRYGYCWVGEVVESRAARVPVGERILALCAHGDEHVLPGRAIHALPQGIPSPRATLAPKLETAVNVVWDAGLALGDRVVVLGGGVVGLLVASLCKRAGASSVRLVEPSQRRRRTAERLGVGEVRAPDEDTPAGDADLVIESTGNPALLDRAIAHAGQEATVVVASFYGERRSPISLGDAFHRRRLQLKSSQVSHLPPAKSARWSHERRLAFALELLADPVWDALIDPPVPFEEAPAVYARLDADPGAALHTVFAYACSGRSRETG